MKRYCRVKFIWKLKAIGQKLLKSILKAWGNLGDIDIYYILYIYSIWFNFIIIYYYLASLSYLYYLFLFIIIIKIHLYLYLMTKHSIIWICNLVSCNNLYSISLLLMHSSSFLPLYIESSIRKFIINYQFNISYLNIFYILFHSKFHL